MSDGMDPTWNDIHGRHPTSESVPVLSAPLTAAEEAWYRNGLPLSPALDDNTRVAVRRLLATLEAERALAGKLRAASAARIEAVRLLMIDGIGTDLSAEFTQGSPFEPFDRIYVLKTITRVLDAARERTRTASEAHRG